MRNTGQDETQARIKIAGRNINNLRYADNTRKQRKAKRKLKNLLMKVKKESEKSWLETQHSKNEDHGTQSYHFLANGKGKSGRSDRFHILELQNHYGQ